MRVALTGATGFLGLRLLGQLLDRGDEVVVLARMPEGRTRFRLERGFAALEGTPERANALAERVSVQQVDLVAAGLGLEAGEFRGLADRVDEVWHVAAETALSGAPERFAVNDEGTRRILELAARGAGRPRVHYVSSVFVAGRHRGPVVMERDLGAAHGFVNHYEESKYRAERLVHEWSRALGRPAVIYRPSVLASDRGLHPHLPIHPLGTMTLLLEQVFDQQAPGRPRAQLALPDTLAGHMNIVQVEWAAEQMVRLSQVLAVAGVTTYHIVHPQPTSSRHVLRMLEAYVPLQFTVTAGNVAENALAVLDPGIAGFLPYLSEQRRYDASNVRAAGEPAAPPEITTEYLIRSVRRAAAPA